MLNQVVSKTLTRPALSWPAAWLLLGSQAAEQTKLRREGFLQNDSVGRPFREELSESISLDFLHDDERLPREHFTVRWCAVTRRIRCAGQS